MSLWESILKQTEEPMNSWERILLGPIVHPTGFLGRLGGIAMARTGRRMNQRAVQLLDVQPSDSVLEIGFGPGVGIQLLAKSVSSGRVAGIDLSEVMVEQAKARNAAGIRTGRVELRRGSAESLPFEDAIFDKVMAVNSMHLWPDAVAGLQETRRVLRPGGRIVLGFHLFKRSWTEELRERVTELLPEAEFTDVRVVDVDEEFYVIAENSGKENEAAN